MVNDAGIEDEQESKINSTSERRSKPRIVCDFPAMVEGIDLQSKKYKENAKLANLSAGGLYLWVNRNIDWGSKISVTVFFSENPIDKDTPKIVTKGIPIRTESASDGTYGVAVKLEYYRFR